MLCGLLHGTDDVVTTVHTTSRVGVTRIQPMSSLQFTRHLMWASPGYRRCRHYNSHDMLCGLLHGTDDVVTTVYTTSRVGVIRVQTMSSLQFTRHLMWASPWYRRCRHYNSHDMLCGLLHGTDEVVTTVYTTSRVGGTRVQTMSSLQFTRHVVRAASWYRRCRHYSLHDISCGRHQGTDDVVTTVYTTSRVGGTRVQTMSSLQFTRHVVRAASWYRRCRDHSLHDISCGRHQGTDDVVTTVHTTCCAGGGRHHGTVHTT